VPDSTTYLDAWNQIRIETRTAPQRLDELLSLDPEPPRAQSAVFDLPLGELTGDPELLRAFHVGNGYHLTRINSAGHSFSFPANHFVPPISPARPPQLSVRGSCRHLLRISYQFRLIRFAHPFLSNVF